jgi:hypothetical protein
VGDKIAVKLPQRSTSTDLRGATLAFKLIAAQHFQLAMRWS